MSNQGQIAFQGLIGAYSYIACKTVFPELSPVAFESFREAANAAESGHCDLAVLPFENTLGGRVADVHRLLDETSLFIVGELYLPIQHHLLAPKGATADSLKSVISHEQALRQCQGVVGELGLEPISAGNTAVAAQAVAESDRQQAGSSYVWPSDHPRTGRGPPREYDAIHRDVPFLLQPRDLGARCDELAVPDQQQPGLALQNARSVRHQRSQPPEARELHGDQCSRECAVLRRSRGRSRRRADGTSTGGGKILLQRSTTPRYVPARTPECETAGLGQL